jgi:hypothetical protein
VTVATVNTNNALTAKAVRFGCFSGVAQWVQSLLMSVMQEDRKLRSNCFALGRHRLLEEMILHLLGQVDPYPNNSLAQRARKLIRDHIGSWIGGWHLSYSHRSHLYRLRRTFSPTPFSFYALLGLSFLGRLSCSQACGRVRHRTWPWRLRACTALCVRRSSRSLGSAAIVFLVDSAVGIFEHRPSGGTIGTRRGAGQGKTPRELSGRIAPWGGRLLIPWGASQEAAQ